MGRCWVLLALAGSVGCGSGPSRGALAEPPLVGSHLSPEYQGEPPFRTLDYVVRPDRHATLTLVEHETSQRKANGEVVAAPPSERQVSAEVAETTGGPEGLSYHVKVGDDTAEGHVSPRGVTAWDAVVSPQEQPQEAAEPAQRLLAAITRLSVALPEGQVGLGARWRIVSATHWRRADVREVITCELLALRDNTAVIDWRIEQTAPVQKVGDPGDGPEIETTLSGYRATGHGELTIDFARPWPTAATATIKTTIDLDARTGGLSQHIVETDVYTAELTSK